MAYEPIIWTQKINTEAIPNANDLKKTSGVDGAWDAGARSEQILYAPFTGCAIKFKLNPNNPAVPWPVYAGLSLQPPPLPGEIAYRIGMGIAQTIIIEFFNILYLGPAYPNQYFTLKCAGSPAKVEFYVSDTLLCTSVNNISLTSLWMSAAIYYLNNAGIIDAYIDVGVLAKIDHLPLLGVH